MERLQAGHVDVVKMNPQFSAEISSPVALQLTLTKSAINLVLQMIKVCEKNWGIVMQLL